MNLNKIKVAALLVATKLWAKVLASAAKPELAHHYSILDRFAKGPICRWYSDLGTDQHIGYCQMVMQGLVRYNSERQEYNLTLLGRMFLMLRTPTRT